MPSGTDRPAAIGTLVEAPEVTAPLVVHFPLAIVHVVIGADLGAAGVGPGSGRTAWISARVYFRAARRRPLRPGSPRGRAAWGAPKRSRPADISEERRQCGGVSAGLRGDERGPQRSSPWKTAAVSTAIAAGVWGGRERPRRRQARRGRRMRKLRIGSAPHFFDGDEESRTPSCSRGATAVGSLDDCRGVAPILGLGPSGGHGASV